MLSNSVGLRHIEKHANVLDRSWPGYDAIMAWTQRKKQEMSGARTEKRKTVGLMEYHWVQEGRSWQSNRNIIHHEACFGSKLDQAMIGSCGNKMFLDIFSVALTRRKSFTILWAPMRSWMGGNDFILVEEHGLVLFTLCVDPGLGQALMEHH